MTAEYKAGNEFLPYHPQASHVSPDYRDGWNACYRAAMEAASPAEGDELTARAFFERWALQADPDKRTNWQIWSAAWTCAMSQPQPKGPSYHLSATEQDVMRKALRRSVTVIGDEPKVAAEVYGWAYTVNGVHEEFHRGAEPPPDDAYDAGTLVALAVATGKDSLTVQAPAPAQQADLRFSWMDFQQIGDLPAVNEAICNLEADPTEDNATCLIRAVVEAAADRLAALAAKAPAVAHEPQGLKSEAEAMRAYLVDCDNFAIVPDVAGAFHFAWTQAASAAPPADHTTLPVPIGTVSLMETEEDGGVSAWVCLNNPVLLGDGLFTEAQMRMQFVAGQISSLKIARGMNASGGLIETLENPSGEPARSAEEEVQNLYKLCAKAAHALRDAAANAARYEWLRTFHVDSYLVCGSLGGLDARIDEAMRESHVPVQQTGDANG